MGCYYGFQFKTLPMSPYVTNPCFYFRQKGLLSSTTVKPALPLVPGIWNVTSYYTTAAGCTDATKQARPLVCSAHPAGTDPGQMCQAQACSVRSVRSRALEPHDDSIFCVHIFTPPPHLFPLFPPRCAPGGPGHRVESFRIGGGRHVPQSRYTTAYAHAHKGALGIAHTVAHDEGQGGGCRRGRGRGAGAAARRGCLRGRGLVT
jgi:hypothetical protein